MHENHHDSRIDSMASPQVRGCGLVICPGRGTIPYASLESYRASIGTVFLREETESLKYGHQGYGC